MRRPRALCLLLLFACACANAPAANDGGVDRPSADGNGGADRDDAGGGRVPKPAPSDIVPEDWVLFLCPSCAGFAPGLRAVRCDGSEEILLGAPSIAAQITGARLTEAFVAASVRNGTGWDLWTRRAGAWQMIALGSTGAGVPKLVGGPHVDGYFSGSALTTRIVYSRSYDTGTDTVSYFDRALGTGYDFFGRALPEADDLQIQFTMLGDNRLAAYEFSPSGQPPGNRAQLEIFDLQAGAFDSMFALEKPDQIAGMRDGSVAVLRAGTVTIHEATGAVSSTLAAPGPVTAIAAVDSGALAFSSGGDLYCARSATDIVRLTASSTEELLFP